MSASAPIVLFSLIAPSALQWRLSPARRQRDTRKPVQCGDDATDMGRQAIVENTPNLSCRSGASRKFRVLKHPPHAESAPRRQHDARLLPEKQYTPIHIESKSYFSYLERLSVYWILLTYFITHAFSLSLVLHHPYHGSLNRRLQQAGHAAGQPVRLAINTVATRDASSMIPSSATFPAGHSFCGRDIAVTSISSGAIWGSQN